MRFNRVLARRPVLSAAVVVGCLMSVSSAQAEVMKVTTLYSQEINPANAVHPLWTPVQHYRGMTFVVCPDVKFRPWVVQIDRAGAVTSVPLDSNPDYTVLTDGHNRFTMGIDKNGYLHVMGDMHGYAPWAGTYVARYQRQSIMYWKSNKALDVTGGFTFCGGLDSATRLPGVEYGGDSRFFNDRNGELYYSSRVRAFEGSTLGGSEPFIAYGGYRYNTSNGVWSALGGKVTPADAPGGRNFNTVLYWEYTHGFEAYQCVPRFDSNNRLHFAIAGNTAGTKGSGLIYAYSDDCGLTWKKANGALIPGLPLRGKDGEANQGDLVVRSATVAQQSPVSIDKHGKLNVAGWTWGKNGWTRLTDGTAGFLGPDSVMTGEGGSVLVRSTSIGQPTGTHDTGFGQVFSISELGVQTSGSIYAIGLPPGHNFPTAPRMSVFRADFVLGGNVATGGIARVPSAPKIFWAQGENTRVWLSWTGVDGATSYKVKRAPAKGGTYRIIAEGVTNTGDYADIGLVNGSPYSYVVSAVGPLGEGPDSVPVRVTPADQPLAPIIQTAVGGNGNVVLNWVPLWPSAISYTVRRAAASGGPMSIIAKGVTGLSYTDTGLKNDTAYIYAVTASNRTGIESPLSAKITGTPFRWIPILKYWSVGYDPAVQGVASASSENPPGELASGAFDGSGRKWLAMANTCWLQYHFTNGVKWAVTRYVLVSGGDGPERDPKDWQFLGSSDGKSWTTLDTRSNEVFSARNESRTFTFSNLTAYPYYRLTISGNLGNGITQLAEMVLWADGAILPPPRR